MKVFITEEEIRKDAIELCKRLVKDDFIPDVIYNILRGGSYMANAISEYFKFKYPKHKPVMFAAVAARSYSGIDTSSEVVIDGWTMPPEMLRPGDKVLLCDDVFDTGHTITKLAQILSKRGCDVRIAVHDIKKDKPGQCRPEPQYICKEVVFDTWINYPHEMIGLTKEEQIQLYGKEI
jgi:hypoxanthine phosphoribosyltransferase